MADPFQPKFVDLVRNRITTTGTGNFTPGAVPAGFTGFADAIAAGESFYYSAIGVDKPAEREVGRGTMQANGTISRDPIGGTLTNFTSGVKNLSLVAAAEWFNEAQASNSATKCRVAASRAELAAVPPAIGSAILSEAGRQGLFVFTTANLSSSVTADPQQGIYVAPSTATSGASGAWVRRVDGEVNVNWFGAKGDGATDDAAAFQAALNYLNTAGGGTLYIPAGTYKISSYLTVYPKTTIRGAGSRASILTTAMAGGGGANAFENVRNGTILNTISPVNSSTPVFVVIRDLGLQCSNSANVGAGYMDRCGTFVQVHNVRIGGFKYGIIFDQTEIADIDLCDFEAQTLAGLWMVNGGDLNPTALGEFTNRISVNRCQFNQTTTAYCVADDGGISHSYTDNNFNGGINHLRMANCVNLRVAGGEFEAAVGAPIVFTHLSLAGNIVGNGGPIHLDGLCVVPVNGQSGISIVSAGTIVMNACFISSSSAAKVAGCANANAIFSTGTGSGGGATFDGKATTHWDVNNSGFAEAKLDLRIATGKKLSFENPGGASHQGEIEHVSSSPYNITRLLAKGGSGGWYGSLRVQTSFSGGALFDALRIDCNSAGTYADASFTGTVAATHSITTSGGTIGYASGAGGTVSQATSKSTGVTINKSCGQVTMHNAALAAGAIVEFTVTNSVVTSNSAIILNLAAGAATTTNYRYRVTSVAAGSFKVAVENRGAASLSEALVFNFSVIRGVNA